MSEPIHLVVPRKNRVLAIACDPKRWFLGRWTTEVDRVTCTGIGATMSKSDRDDLLYTLSADHSLIIAAMSVLKPVINVDIKEVHRLLYNAMNEASDKINALRDKQR